MPVVVRNPVVRRDPRVQGLVRFAEEQAIAACPSRK